MARLADFEAGRLQARYDGGFDALESLAPPRRDLYPGGYFTEVAFTSKGCLGPLRFLLDLALLQSMLSDPARGRGRG